MTAGIVGLGLIGGSLAKAYHEAGERVLAHDIDRDVLSFAVISGAVDEALTDETMAECDVILLAVRPAAAVEWLKNHAAKIDKHTVVIDCCGTKRKVCAACFPIAEQYGITYLGGHPMAGTQFSGFKYAKANLFVGAPMVLVPPRFDDIELLSHVKDLLSPAGFGSCSVTTAEQHDEMIAFTSQLAHVASNAYIKSPTAKKHKGFSAGSYKDMTRVAWLAPHMWAELFMENKEFLLKEIDCYIDCCGTKRKVCAACFPIAEQYGITYLGGHPMAGTQFSGFKYAKANLFVGAPMVLVPPRFDDIELLSHVKDLLSPAGFGSCSVTTAEQHDEMIAFTSQLAHVASNAYIKSPTAKKHKGFSAGSYKDMTRVAWLAPHMWAELFMENKEFLLKEIDCYIEHLSEYKTAMEHDDEETLIRLLDEGKKRKEEVDG